MNNVMLEKTGWSSIDISPAAQNKVEQALRAAGVAVSDLDVFPWRAAYHAFRHIGEYDSDYKVYAGAMEHCLLEKTLEHFLSLILIDPRPGMTGVDVGSCQSILPGLVRRVYGTQVYEQDLTYPDGVHGERIGSSADAIPLPDHSVDFMTLHCTFEHFEGNADTGYVRECARLLRPGGKAIILPLYLNESLCNITGETNTEIHRAIGWDAEAAHYCLIPEWQNRFGRHYSPEAFIKRVYNPALESGLNPILYKIHDWSIIHPDLWLRWILVLEA